MATFEPRILYQLQCQLDKLIQLASCWRCRINSEVISASWNNYILTVLIILAWDRTGLRGSARLGRRRGRWTHPFTRREKEAATNSRASYAKITAT